MSRKIVIIPTFASSHFLKCWILNVLEVLNPDVIIINEGLFPNGPENKKEIDNNFRKKWCYSKQEIQFNVGFDWEETVDILEPFVKNSQYRAMQIYAWPMQYSSNDVNQCFLESISSFHIDFLEPEPGDLIFPLEPDAFLFECDKEVISEEISKLMPGEGIQCKWMDFLETQYYTEAINLQNPKFRRFCYCFDNLENYKKAIDGFMSQNYPLLRKTESFFIRHYPWFVFDKWKELRYDIIYRSDPQYWKDFESGLNAIRTKTQEYLEHPWIIENSRSGCHGIPEKSWIFGDKWNGHKVEIRPSRQDEGRWAKFIDVEHPKHIMNHPNFVK